MHQGVEERGRSGLPPPMINTVASDRVAQLGRNGPAPMTAAVPAPPSMMMAPVQSRQAPVNPLGGMDSRPLSERGSGGPMSYSPRGVGTNNPMSFAVGQNNKDFAMRTGQAPMMPPLSMRPGPMMLGGYVPPQSSNGMPPPPMLPAPGRDDAFWNQMSSDTSAFLGEQQKLGMDMQLADQTAAAEAQKNEMAMQVTTAAVPGTNYVIPFAGNKAMGTLPVQKDVPAMTADDIAAARAMGGDVSIQQGDTQVRLPGMTATPQAEVKLPKIYQGKADLAGKLGRDYYYELDAKTGQPRKVYIEDANGDGVPDNAPAAAPTGDPKARMNALRKRLNLPEL